MSCSAAGLLYCGRRSTTGWGWWGRFAERRESTSGSDPPSPRLRRDRSQFEAQLPGSDRRVTMAGGGARFHRKVDRTGVRLRQGYGRTGRRTRLRLDRIPLAQLGRTAIVRGGRRDTEAVRRRRHVLHIAPCAQEVEAARERRREALARARSTRTNVYTPEHDAVLGTDDLSVTVRGTHL